MDELLISPSHHSTSLDSAVECLGMTFDSDQRRREYFLEKLREKLLDPEFQEMAGFPIGEAEDILALSDPPYYTACPNPFVADFIAHHGTPYCPDEPYVKEPFASDVREGKNDPIYNAHSYHTKVPHKAIMRYLLHYTKPGDLVFDGFCGTGMTGVASQLCGDPGSLAKLGYRINQEDDVLDETGNSIGKLGVRKAILNDLSPAATLIAAGYNLTTSPETFSNLAKQLLRKFQEQYGWMYQTVDPDSKDVCNIDFTVWSEVLGCPNCSGRLEFWNIAYDATTGKMADELICTHCSARLKKRDLTRVTTQYYDKAVGTSRPKQTIIPVEIHYRHRGARKKKLPEEDDIKLLERIEDMLDSIDYPTDLMMFKPEGEEWGDLYRGYHYGISRVHDFHLVRQLVAFSILWRYGDELTSSVTDQSSQELRRLWHFTLQSIMVSFTKRNRFRKDVYSQVNVGLSGTLYVGSTVSEPSPLYAITGKLDRFKGAVPASRQSAVVTTQSLEAMLMPDDSVDYAFIDPPFGDNLPYAELNFLWEAWLGVFTNAAQDAVVSEKQAKDLTVYTELMTSCLKEVYRVLKPGRWVTVEFHNSKNAVWTAIQEALGKAGLVVADVRILDKGMLTKKQLNANAVNKDLVLSAYKPNDGLEKRFKLEAGTEDGVWDVVRSHLRQLPVFVSAGGVLEVVPERQNHLLFDRMVAFHVQRDTTIPLSAADFYLGLGQRFPMRDGMYFLPDQVVEYDKMRITSAREIPDVQLFVSDEASAIQWLRQLLSKRPQTFQDIHPQFLKEIGGWLRHEKALELSELLEQNFLRFDGNGQVPSQLHSYLSSNFRDLRNLDKDDPALRSKGKDRWYAPDPNKAADLEKLRERALMREFEEYRGQRQRRLTVFRVEAVRAGFKKAWQERDYTTILAVARKIPENILREDDKLLMWYDQALTRSGQ